ITGIEARTYGHQLRAEADAVVVGAGTVRLDNPALTVRHVPGRNPYRVIITASGKLPSTAKLWRDRFRKQTIVVTTRRGREQLARMPLQEAVEIWTVAQDRSGRVNLSSFLRKAAEFGFRSLLIEGGPTLTTAFMKKGFVDKCAVFTAPIILGDGLSAFGSLGVRRVRSAWRLADKSVQPLGDDILVTGYPERAA
ncbi:MAG: RibD family protein, partial [Candidatus Zixiibacteriota bacterium]